ncbi:protein sprint-like isoform X3 [Amphibalanus amphitrite]|nr:protein sprint-like isoform X3 [Amphibalanus amphitrite]
MTSQTEQLACSPEMTAAQKKLLQLNNNRNQEDSAMSSSCSELEPCPPAEMSITERLIHSQPVWFLPGIHRAGAEHLLQGKPPGTFIVRESSNTASMALSVRLPAGKGPHVEHFLIEKQDGKLSLESSDNRFSDICSLVACYSSRCDELPVQLRLPDSLQKAESRHQLLSRALLGQEFWQSRLANCSQGGSTGASGSTQSSTASSSLNKVGGSQSSLGSLCSPPGAPPPPHTETLTSQSSLGSSSGPPPSDSPLTTFGRRLSSGRPGEGRASPATPAPLGAITERPAEGARRPAVHPRPAPPTSLQLQPAAARLHSPALVGRVASPVGGEPAGRAVPPRPPPRWCKPSLTPPAALNGFCAGAITNGNGFGAVRSEVSALRGSAASGRQVRSASNTPVRELAPTPGSAPWRQTASPATTPASCDDDVLLPGGAPRASRRRGRKKRSTHYQEADILELPVGICRSSVADKISDYEDIWASPPREIPESTFKPRTAARSMNDLSEAAREPAVVPPVSGDRTGLRLELTPARTACPELRSPRSSGANSSPFYAIPADAVRPASAICSETVSSPADGVVQRRAPFDRTAAHRHSEPNIRWEPPGRSRRPGAARLETIDSSDELPPLSSSVDNLASAPRRLRAGSRSHSSHGLGEAARRVKAVPPPRVQSPRRPRQRRAARGWRLDAEWAFVGADNEGFEADTEAEADEGAVQLRRPPVEPRDASHRLSESTESEAAGPPTLSKEEESRIVQAYIRQSLPQIAGPILPSSLPVPEASISASDYDNVRPLSSPPPPAPAPPPPGIGVSPPLTDITETSKWESIMRLMQDQLRLRTGQFEPETAEERPFTDSESFVHVQQEAPPAEDDTATSDATVARPEAQRLARPRAPQESLYSPPRLTSLRLHRRSQQSGAAIREYVLQLATSETSNTFALNVQKFLQCTREASETEPHVVMRNTRQFVNGMKNYLVKHGEGNFHQIVDSERDKLASTAFLNLDVILEGVLEELLVRPLYDHFKHLTAEAGRRSGAIQRLTENLELTRGRPAASLGAKPERPPPTGAALEAIRATMERLQEAVSPLDKLENLLAVVSDVFAAAGAKDESLPADELLPLLIYTMAQCNCASIEFEADYMWGLLHPMLLNGEAGYYLTMLSSAVHVLKNLPHYLDDRSRESTRSLSHCSGSVSGSEPVDGLLRVVIPDEQQGTIISRTLPARPTTSAREVCRMLGNKLRITSPTDYGLFKLIDGCETLLGDLDCPQHIKQELTARGTHCMLAYKRLEAKIAWPTAQL